MLQLVDASARGGSNNGMGEIQHFQAAAAECLKPCFGVSFDQGFMQTSYYTV